MNNDFYQTQFEELIFKIYKRCNNNSNKILEEIDSLKLNFDFFMTSLTNYIKKNFSRPLYAIVFDNLLNLSTSDEVIEYIKQSNVELSYLKQNLYSYIINYNPELIFDKKANETLHIKLDWYQLYLKELDTPASYATAPVLCVSTSRQIMQMFLESNYGIDKFCLINKISRTTFLSALKKIKSIDQDLHSNVERSINQKEFARKNNIQDDINKIINGIKVLEKEFNSIDFFQTTIYTPMEIILAIKNSNLTKSDIILLKTFLEPLKGIKQFSELATNNLIGQRVTTLNTSDQVITLTIEDKKTIVNYLRELEIPICSVTFYDACHKYAKGNLINQNAKQIKL